MEEVRKNIRFTDAYKILENIIKNDTEIRKILKKFSKSNIGVATLLRALIYVLNDSEAKKKLLEAFSIAAEKTEEKKLARPGVRVAQIVELRIRSRVRLS